MKNMKRKIDPALDTVTINSGGEEPLKVILYAREYAKCRPVLDEMGIKVACEVPLINGYIVELPVALLNKIARRRHIKYIAADLDVQAQMNIASRVVGVDELHRKGVTGKGIGIAILDTGIYPHPDFTVPNNRIAAFVDIVNGRSAAYDDNGHGTFVSAVAAGNGHMSAGAYRGIAPDATIVSAKVMDAAGGGKTSDVLAAMQWVADNHEKYNIKVVSLSLGSSMGIAQRDDAMERAAEQLWRRGITVVVAAGNDGPEPATITVPGTSRILLTVGASDDKRTLPIDDDEIAPFSSRGPVGTRSKPDVVAPGVNIMSAKADTAYLPGIRATKPTQYYTVMSGTSVSTPLVAGLAALLYQQTPDITPDGVKRELMKNARALTGMRNNEGSGIVYMV